MEGRDPYFDHSNENVTSPGETRARENDGKFPCTPIGAPVHSSIRSSHL